MIHTPIVIEKEGRGERVYDIYSRLLKDRIVILNDDVNANSGISIVAQLLFLASEDSDKDINIYINSPGGVISDGMAIYDTMNHISCDVSTICLGQAASMGAFLLAAGTKGKRFILPSAEVMIHQPSGGTRGQATDIEINAKHILRTKDKMNNLLANFTGQDISKVAIDTERDYWMTAEEAVAYGIVDKVHYPQN